MGDEWKDELKTWFMNLPCWSMDLLPGKTSDEQAIEYAKMVEFIEGIQQDSLKTGIVPNFVLRSIPVVVDEITILKNRIVFHCRKPWEDRGVITTSEIQPLYFKHEITNDKLPTIDPTLNTIMFVPDAIEMAFLGWKPTPDNINRLPDPLRKYVHDLVTNCDPTGIVQENAGLKEQRDALVVQKRDLFTKHNIPYCKEHDIPKIWRPHDELNISGFWECPEPIHHGSCRGSC